MSICIEHYPIQQYQLNFYSIPIHNFKINLNQAFKEKLNGGQELTHTLALKILKQVKLESDVLSFLTKRIVFIPLSAVMFAAGFFLPETRIVLIAAGIMMCALGGFMLGICINSPHFLPLLSQAYSKRGQKAAEYIDRLKSDPTLVITLA